MILASLESCPGKLVDQILDELCGHHISTAIFRDNFHGYYWDDLDQDDTNQEGNLAALAKLNRTCKQFHPLTTWRLYHGLGGTTIENGTGAETELFMIAGGAWGAIPGRPTLEDVRVLELIRPRLGRDGWNYVALFKLWPGAKKLRYEYGSGEFWGPYDGIGPVEAATAAAVEYAPEPEKFELVFTKDLVGWLMAVAEAPRGWRNEIIKERMSQLIKALETSVARGVVCEILDGG